MLRRLFSALFGASPAICDRCGMVTAEGASAECAACLERQALWVTNEECQRHMSAWGKTAGRSADDRASLAGERFERMVGSMTVATKSKGEREWP